MKLLLIVLVLFSETITAQPIHIRPSFTLIAAEPETDSLVVNFYRVQLKNDTVMYGIYKTGNQWESNVIVSEDSGQYFLEVLKGKERMVIIFETEGADIKTDYYGFGFTAFRFSKGCYRFDLRNYLNANLYKKSDKKFKLRFDGSDGRYRSPGENMLDLNSIPLTKLKTFCEVR
jgi:hypothetical protein